MIKLHAGAYKTKSGWIIERSAEGGWNVYNAEGGLVDNLPTKKQAIAIYG